MERIIGPEECVAGGFSCRETEGLLSVIVPVYRTEKEAACCIDSLRRQSWKQMEIIIVNDGSPGRIREMALEWMLEDSRIRYLEHPENLGLFRARLTGIAASRGEFIGFVDSDDEVSYDYFHGLIRRALETGADMVIGRTVRQEGSARFVYNLHESMLDFDLMEADAFRRLYFSQEGACYGLHTIWNKLCRRRLWENACPC